MVVVGSRGPRPRARIGGFPGISARVPLMFLMEIVVAGTHFPYISLSKQRRVPSFLLYFSIKLVLCASLYL